MKYEIRQIDAWSSGESWTWNESYKIGEFKTSAADHKRAFLNALRKIGIVCKRGKCKVEFDGDIGVYYTILEDLEYINPKELIAEILETFKQWKSDINSAHNPKYKAICNFEFDLIAML